MGTSAIFKNRNEEFIQSTIADLIEFNQSLSPNYSLEIRKQVIEFTLNSNLTHRQIAERFGIKYTVLTNLVSKSKKTGQILVPKEFGQIIKKRIDNK